MPRHTEARAVNVVVLWNAKSMKLFSKKMTRIILKL